MFTLAHLSDLHLALTPKASEFASKRALGYINWQRKRKHIHRPDVLAVITRDLQARSAEHVAVIQPGSGSWGAGPSQNPLAADADSCRHDPNLICGADHVDVEPWTESVEDHRRADEHCGPWAGRPSCARTEAHGCRNVVRVANLQSKLVQHRDVLSVTCNVRADCNVVAGFDLVE